VKVTPVVIGLELSHDAVQDANDNQKENGLAQYNCIEGKAEDTFRKCLWGMKADDRIVAVVDPPRSGLHINVIKAIRECHKIDRVVYVSCNPQTLIRDLAQFARSQSNNMIGLAFKPLRAVCVDMFPQTRNVESVVLLQRATEREYSPKDTSKYQEGVTIKKKKKNLRKKIEKKVLKELLEQESKRLKEKERIEKEQAELARRPEQPLDPKFDPNFGKKAEKSGNNNGNYNNRRNKYKDPDVINLSVPTKRSFEDISTD